MLLCFQFTCKKQNCILTPACKDLKKKKIRFISQLSFSEHRGEFSLVSQLCNLPAYWLIVVVE
jgi:hypothetical protein